MLYTVWELIVAYNCNIEFLEPTEEEFEHKQDEQQEQDEYMSDVSQKQLQDSID